MDSSLVGISIIRQDSVAVEAQRTKIGITVAVADGQVAEPPITQ